MKESKDNIKPKITTMKVSEIVPNEHNPRNISEKDFNKLVKSIKEFPDMLFAREIILNKDKMVLGGNMRLKACIKAGVKEVPVKIVDWSEEKQREFIIKDNVSGGNWDWDVLANEWDTEELEDWGVNVLKTDFGDIDSFFEDSEEKRSDEKPKQITCPECGHEFEA